MEKEKEKLQQGIDIAPDTIGGIYSNMAMVSHSHADFVVDLLSLLPGMPRPQVRSRIIMAPEHAKRLAMALNENIKKYESLFGEIELTQTQVPMAFKLPKGEA